MRRLLFLNGIKAFEAAARSGSLAAAGSELNVSAAAVSRMVDLLEQRLGVALFERKANRLAMTSAGRAYQNGLTPIFDALASLTAQVTAPSSVRVLTIGVGPTFAMKWLIPRLADFRKDEPDIAVRITTGGAAAPFGDDWSCGIQLGDGEWPRLAPEPLVRADLRPGGRACGGEGAKGHARVPGLPQLPRREARLGGVPALDHAPGGETGSTHPPPIQNRQKSSLGCNISIILHSKFGQQEELPWRE